MAHGNQLILDHPRSKWVHDAARAIIATGSPGSRFMLLREGFRHFARVTRPEFAHRAPGIRFTSRELRWIFHYLHAYVSLAHANGRKEIDDWPRLERILQAQRNKNPTPPDDDDTSGLDDTIEVTSATRGRVH